MEYLMFEELRTWVRLPSPPPVFALTSFVCLAPINQQRLSDVATDVDGPIKNSPFIFLFH